MNWPLIISTIGLVIAVLSAVFTAGAWLAAKKALTYQALADVMRDYAKDRFAEDVGTLRNFYKKDCAGSSKSLAEEFGRLLDNRERPDVTSARRRVSHFYQRIGALYVGKVLPAKVLYRLWSKYDLSIIPKIIIPLERVLYERLHGKRPTNQFRMLQDLYDGSTEWWKEIDGPGGAGETGD